MNTVKNLLKVQKTTLLFVAGLVWSFAGYRVSTIGIGDTITNHGNLILATIFASLVFFVFFKFIFSNMFKKHTKRIMGSNLEKQYVFGFFDLKSYLIMAFMITFGITIRGIGVFNPVVIGIFYTGLGCALFMAGILFLLSFLNFRKRKENISIDMENSIWKLIHLR